MKRAIINVTGAARNFADCVNRAHYQNVTLCTPQEWNSFCSPGSGQRKSVPWQWPRWDPGQSWIAGWEGQSMAPWPSSRSHDLQAV